MKETPKDSTDFNLDDFESFLHRSESFDSSLLYSLLNLLMDIKNLSDNDMLLLKYFNKMIVEADSLI